MERLDGVRVLLSGGTGGIGLAMAPALAGSGARSRLASPEAADVHDERIVATGFDAWLAARRAGG